MSNRRRTILFLYSRPNIVGSLLALVGLLLYFSGVIQGPLALFVVIGLYLAGVIGVRRSRMSLQEFQQAATQAEIHEKLLQMDRRLRRRVPKEIYGKFAAIRKSIEEILPYILDINSADPHIFTIRQTALVYLPKALENYLNLPPEYARFHPVQGKKTAQALMLEQLTILEREMKEIADDFHKNDSQRLIAHGRFLEERFRTGKNWIE